MAHPDLLTSWIFAHSSLQKCFTYVWASLRRVRSPLQINHTLSSLIHAWALGGPFQNLNLLLVRPHLVWFGCTQIKIYLGLYRGGNQLWCNRHLDVTRRLTIGLRKYKQLCNQPSTWLKHAEAGIRMKTSGMLNMTKGLIYSDFYVLFFFTPRRVTEKGPKRGKEKLSWRQNGLQYILWKFCLNRWLLRVFCFCDANS